MTISDIGIADIINYYDPRVKKWVGFNGIDSDSGEEGIAFLGPGYTEVGKPKPRIMYVTSAHRGHLGRHPHKAVGNSAIHEQHHDSLEVLDEFKASDALDTMDRRLRERLGL